MSEERIFAEITVNSLVTLGFKIENYIDKYPSITIGLNPLDYQSFDRSNEKMLLMTAHFLLCILEGDLFESKLISFWPYKATKDKTDFKRVVLSTIRKLEGTGIISATPEAKSVLFNQFKGHDVWKLLRNLSDAALDIQINEFETDDSNHEEMEEEEKKITGNAEIDHKANENNIRAKVVSEFLHLQSIASNCVNRQDNQHVYIHELEQRLKRAYKSMEASKIQLNEIAQGDKLQVLSEAAKLQRSELTYRLINSKKLLEEKAQNPTLQKSNDIVEEFKQTVSIENISYDKSVVTSNLANSQPKTKCGEKKIPLGDFIEELISDLDALGDFQ
jgi:hypothetical protein